jgi:hypothetical protein
MWHMFHGLKFQVFYPEKKIEEMCNVNPSWKTTTPTKSWKTLNPTTIKKTRGKYFNSPMIKYSHIFAIIDIVCNEWHRVMKHGHDWNILLVEIGCVKFNNLLSHVG